MNNHDLAYLAGAFDGDGSISLCRRKGKDGVNDSYYPLIQLAKVTRYLPELFQNQFGGYLQTRSPYVGKDGVSRLGSFIWRNDRLSKCKVILEQLLPYLSQKKEQANLVLEYINQNPFQRGIVLTAEDHKKRENQYYKLGMLKQKDTTGKRISKKPRINNNDPVFLSYLAGLMDTDGSFSIKRESRKNIVHSPVILLSMVDIPSLNFIKDNTVEGDIYIIEAKQATYGSSYRYAIYSKPDSISFLEKILPYLRIKRSNALCLLDFCKNMKPTSYRRDGIMDEELQNREDCYKKLRELNDGVYKSPLIVLNPLPDNAGGNKEQAGQKPCSLNAVSEETDKIGCGTLNIVEIQ